MIYRFKDYILDENRHELRRADEAISIEPRVFQILLYLLQNRDRVVYKEELLQQCWPDIFVSDSALTRCLTKLRRAVYSGDGAHAIIKTVHRQGYRFVADATIVSHEDLASDILPAASGDVASISVDASALALPLHLSSNQSAIARIPQDRVVPAAENPQMAERRQLTILSCALIGAVQLAEQLDLEVFHEIMRTFHASCTAIVLQFSGHIAQRLDDSLLVYFGYPQAHEHDVQRAVRAGLALVESSRSSLSALACIPEGAPGIRIGIHTGVVVVEPPSNEDGLPLLAVGATSMVAVGLRGLAAPNAVVISETTARLVEGYFVWHLLGVKTLPGQLQPLALYQIMGEGEQQTPLEVSAIRGLTPFVGRTTELALLQERWSQVQDGLGQVIVLSGEAGIGKSRLVHVFREMIADASPICMECRCSPYHQHTPLYPVIDWLRRRLQQEDASTKDEQVKTLEQLVQRARLDVWESVSLLASLLGLSLPTDRYPPLTLTLQKKRQRSLEALLAIVLTIAEQKPVLFVFEDLHWIDPTTLEWLGLLIDQGPTTSLMTLLTCRPTFQSPWSRRTHVTSLTLNRFARQQATEMVQYLTAKTSLPPSVVEQVILTADGVPLFMEEVTKLVVETDTTLSRAGSGAIRDAKLTASIPMTLQDSLMARLDQVGVGKRTAQLGAVIGREFSFFLMKAVSPLTEEMLESDLRQLLEAELFYQHGVGDDAIYLFKHALIQEAAYTSLLRQVRQEYHLKIAQVFEYQYPELIALHPELVTHHYTEAGMFESALSCWQQAGTRATERST